MFEEDSCASYVIVYTNDKTVQGHCVYCLVSKVNIVSQGRVQRVKLTYPMQVSTVESYHHLFRAIGRQFLFMWGIVRKWV